MRQNKKSKPRLEMRLDQQSIVIEDVMIAPGLTLIAITSNPITTSDVGYHGRLLLNFKKINGDSAFTQLVRQAEGSNQSTRFRVTIDAELVHEGQRDGGI